MKLITTKECIELLDEMNIKTPLLQAYRVLSGVRGWNEERDNAIVFTSVLDLLGDVEEGENKLLVCFYIMNKGFKEIFEELGLKQVEKDDEILKTLKEIINEL